MRSRGRSARGLTLLEVIISIALIAMLLGALMTFFWQTLAIRDQAARMADRTQIVQQMLERMAAELRSSYGLAQVGFPVAHFSGDRRKIAFLTAPLPATDSYVVYQDSEDRPAWPHDIVEVTYELWIDPDKTTDDGEPLVGGILRTQRRAIEPTLSEEEVPEGEEIWYLRRDLWSHELGYLEFRYFDGVEWTTRWEVNEGNPLPQLIQITVGFDSLKKFELDDKDLESYPIERYPLGPDVPNLDRYSMIVRLPAADPMFSSRMQRLANGVTEVYQFMQGAGAEAQPPADETGTGGKP